MDSYIPHRILVINHQITKDAQDEALLRCYRLAFDWANKMGLQGKKLFDFHVEDDPPITGTFNETISLWCKIECTEEERKRWEELQKLQIKHAVLTALSE